MKLEYCSAMSPYYPTLKPSVTHNTQPRTEQNIPTNTKPLNLAISLISLSQSKAISTQILSFFLSISQILSFSLSISRSASFSVAASLSASLHPHPYQNTVSLSLSLTPKRSNPKRSNPHTLTPSAAEIKNVVVIAFAYRWWPGEWNRGLRRRRAWGNRRRETGGCWRSDGNGLSVGWQWCDVVFVLIFFFALSSPCVRPIRVFNFISQSRYADHFPFNGAL